MRNKVWTFARTMPRRKLVAGVIFALLLALISGKIMLGLYYYLAANSVTVSELPNILYNVLGTVKYYSLLNVVKFVSTLSYFLLFLLYLYVFLHYQTRRQYGRDLEQIMAEMQVIAGGNFDYQMKDVYDRDLHLFAENIDSIVKSLQAAMVEELRLEQTKNELITNVSHDLRTPLTSIVGYLRLIEQDTYRDEVALRHYTGIAYEKALHLERLINELFEYTRMQDSKYQFRMTPVSISEILQQLIIQNRHEFAEAGMICRESIPAGKLLVLGDGERLARVFENLLTNALYYGKDASYIDIIAREIADTVVIEVINYGEQIPSADIPHIFERFYRAEKSRARHTGGSGLGLAIVKSIVTHHHGNVRVESSVERTSFIVELPKMADV